MILPVMKVQMGSSCLQNFSKNNYAFVWFIGLIITIKNRKRAIFIKTGTGQSAIMGKSGKEMFFDGSDADNGESTFVH